MSAESAIRLLDHLPAIYRDAPADSDFARLLAVFEELLFAGAPGDAPGLAGAEHALAGLPALFSPLGMADTGVAAGHDRRTPDAFVPWLATWLAFTPRALFTPQRLRRIVAGIVPMYGRRGTRGYLADLLRLCFDEIASVRIGDQGVGGLRVGRARLGVDSLLTDERPFWFSIDIGLHPHGGDAADDRGHGLSASQLESRVRAVVDFAKPAHTDYQLRLSRGTPAR